MLPAISKNAKNFMVPPVNGAKGPKNRKIFGLATSFKVFKQSVFKMFKYFWAWRCNEKLPKKIIKSVNSFS